MAEKDATFAGLSFDEVKDLTSAGLPLDQVKDLAKAGFSAEQMLDLAASTMPKQASGGGGLSKEDLAEVIKGAARAAAEAGSEGMRKVLHPQNAQHPHISAFSYPEGNVKRPKPKMARAVIFCGHREDPDQLTPDEIAAFNAIDKDYTARDGSWMATVKRNGKSEELHITVPMTLDGRMGLPALEMICRELSQGQAAVDPKSLAQRVADLERQLQERGAGASV